MADLSIKRWDQYTQYKKLKHRHTSDLICMKNLKNRSLQIYTSAIFSPAFSCLKHTYNKFMESSLINCLFTYMTNETVLLNYSYILDEEEESSSETRLPLTPIIKSKKVYWIMFLTDLWEMRKSWLNKKNYGKYIKYPQ